MARPHDDTMWSGLLHHGVSGTFLRAPHVAAEAGALRAAGAKSAILGFPWDSTTISRTGSNLGPRALRAASSLFLPYSLPRGVDLREAARFVDCGDVPVVPGDLEGTMAKAQGMAGAILDGGAMPFILGGEHSVTIAGARALASRRPGGGFVLIDSHLDTADDVGGVKLTHCAPVTRAIEAGFDPRKTVIIGPSGWLNPRSEYDYCKRSGVTVFWLEDVIEQGVPAIVAKTRAVLAGAESLYLSVDIDALDLAHAPGTCVPTAGGMSMREMMGLIHGLRGLPLDAADLVEVAPTLDPAGTTQVTGARLVLEMLLMRFGS